MKPELSIVVLVKDEEARLPRFFEALRPLKLRHEVLVVDSGSRDRSASLARAAGARVLRRPWAGFAATRNRAFKDCRAPWILVLDADENPDGSLLAAVERAVRLEPPCLWRVNRLNYFLGDPVRHGGWFPDRHLRLFPKGAAEFEERSVHEGMRPLDASLALRKLDGLLHHHSYPDLAGYMARLNRYTTLQAQELFERKGARPATAVLRMATDPGLTFLKMYGLKLGVLDGGLGLVVAVLSASSTFWKYAKWWQLSWRARGGEAGVPWPLRPGAPAPLLGAPEEYR
ncbi:MAG TPA: glycosyltransferase family 2 protein [bacterium]|jgi:glycosyltransferase involved in cell wall biosynthesis|nr:glycosyltransferase family 2 protein [bacterium]